MKEKDNKKQIRNTLLLVLTAFIWGTAFVAQSVGADYVGPFTFLALRSWLGAAFLLPVIFVMDRIRKKRGEAYGFPPEKTKRKNLILGGILCGLLLFSASITQQIGIAYTTTAKAGFITALYVLIVPVVSIFFGRRTGGKIWICVCLGVVGLYLLCMQGAFSLTPGDTWVMVCAFLFSGQILVIDHYSPKVDGVRMSCIQFFVVAVIATVGMILWEHPTGEIIRQGAIPILYAGILSSGVAYTLQIVAQKGLNPTIASLAMSLECVFSALAGWLVLGEGLSLRELIGCICMFAAIVLAQVPLPGIDRKKA